MKGYPAAFILFTAFAIVLAHGIIPHHHHSDHHAFHHHHHSHSDAAHHEHPSPADFADHHNLTNWFIHGKKDLQASINGECADALNSYVLQKSIILPEVTVKEISLPPEANRNITHQGYMLFRLLRAPPMSA